MSDWFLVSAWFEKAEQEVHFEMTNEDGEQFFFSLESELIIKKVTKSTQNALDAFYYAEEDMLAMAVDIIEAEMLEPECSFFINDSMAHKHFI